MRLRPFYDRTRFVAVGHPSKIHFSCSKDNLNVASSLFLLSPPRIWHPEAETWKFSTFVVRNKKGRILKYLHQGVRFRVEEEESGWKGCSNCLSSIKNEFWTNKALRKYTAKLPQKVQIIARVWSIVFWLCLRRKGHFKHSGCWH